MANARLSVNLNPETEAALRRLANEQGMSITEVIRRAVSTYAFVHDRVQEGKELQLAEGGQVTKVVLL
jgi:hypothetical protein